MKPLRKKMIDAMVLRGFADSTQSTYLHWVTDLAKYYRCSPERLSRAQVEQYLLSMIQERKLAPSTVRLSLNAIRFLFLHVLKRKHCHFVIAYPKLPQKIPDLLTREEVHQILAHCRNKKHHALLSTGYAAGLRVSELVALEVRNIDSAKHVLHIKQAKGAKDRDVPCSDALLFELRCYWQYYRPYKALFYGTEIDKALSISCAQKTFKAAKHLAKIDKNGGIHSLRHAYATHQLDAGLPLHRLQQMMGHRDIKSTMRYVHWISHYKNSGLKDIDLLQW